MKDTQLALGIVFAFPILAILSPTSLFKQVIRNIKNNLK